jgi:uncharacterized protein (DUF2147 family)
MKYKFIICLTVLKLACINALAQGKADDIAGIWLTGGKESAKIQIYKSGEKYFGKIIWLKYPEENGRPRIDSNNPNKAKRNSQIIGLVILKGFQFDGEDEWEDARLNDSVGQGKIYDPESGKTYSCYLSLKDKTTLKVRGYVGILWFGRTETWTKTTF